MTTTISTLSVKHLSQSAWFGSRDLNGGGGGAGDLLVQVVFSSPPVVDSRWNLENAASFFRSTHVEVMGVWAWKGYAPTLWGLRLFDLLRLDTGGSGSTFGGAEVVLKWCWSMLASVTGGYATLRSTAIYTRCLCWLRCLYYWLPPITDPHRFHNGSSYTWIHEHFSYSINSWVCSYIQISMMQSLLPQSKFRLVVYLFSCPSQI
jgi:hypothetical protein